MLTESCSVKCLNSNWKLLNRKNHQFYLFKSLQVHCNFINVCVLVECKNVYASHQESILYCFIDSIFYGSLADSRSFYSKYSSKVSGRSYSLLGYTQASDLSRIRELCFSDSCLVIVLRKSLKENNIVFYVKSTRSRRSKCTKYSNKDSKVY